MEKNGDLSHHPDSEQSVARLVLEGDVIVACNEHAQSLLLSTNNKLLGQSFLAYSAVEQSNGRSSAASLKLRSVAALAGQPQKFEWIVRKSDGSELQVQMTMNKAKADGKYFVQLRFYPLTNKHESDETLLLIKQGIEQTPVAIFLADVDGYILYSNQGFRELYGYSPADFRGRFPQVLVSGTLAELSHQEYWLNLLCQNKVSVDIIPDNYNGTPIRIEGIHTPIIDKTGNLKGFFAIHQGLTDSKQDLQTIVSQAHEKGLLKDN